MERRTRRMSVEGNGTTLVQIVAGRAEATVMAEGMEEMVGGTVWGTCMERVASTHRAALEKQGIDSVPPEADGDLAMERKPRAWQTLPRSSAAAG